MKKYNIPYTVYLQLFLFIISAFLYIVYFAESNFILALWHILLCFLNIYLGLRYLSRVNK